MARCKHKFELTVIKCPMGCGGTAKPQKQVTGKIGRAPERDPLLEPRVKSFTDDELRAALTGSPSVKAAMIKLGTHWHQIRDRAKAVPELWEIYKECRRRGRATRKRPEFRRVS